MMSHATAESKSPESTKTISHARKMIGENELLISRLSRHNSSFFAAVELRERKSTKEKATE